MSTEAQDALLGGGGAPSASFLELGTTIRGKIVAIGQVQQREFKTNVPKVWSDGTPMMQSVITLETEQDDPDDNGYRRVFVKPAMAAAIREAVHKAGHDPKSPMEGGILAIRYSGDGPSPGSGMDGPKQFQAQFTPPVAKAQDAMMDGYDDSEPF